MSTAAERIQHAGLRQKIISAEQAAAFIENGMTVGISGFTGAGYPKAVPADRRPQRRRPPTPPENPSKSA